MLGSQDEPAVVSWQTDGIPQVVGTSGLSGTYSERTGDLLTKGAWYEYQNNMFSLNAAMAVPTGVANRGRTGVAGDIANIDSCHTNNPSQFECCAQQCVESPLGDWSRCMSGGSNAGNNPFNAVNARMSYPTMVLPTTYEPYATTCGSGHEARSGATSKDKCTAMLGCVYDLATDHCLAPPDTYNTYLHSEYHTFGNNPHCSDLEGWVDRDGDDCAKYVGWDLCNENMVFFNRYPTLQGVHAGKTAKDACQHSCPGMCNDLLSYGKSADQSNARFGTTTSIEARKAVDGNSDPAGADVQLTHTCTHTVGTSGWWQVDLGNVKPVGAVAAYIHSAYGNRAEVWLSNTPDYTDRNAFKCGDLTEAEFDSVICGQSGRWVTISSDIGNGGTSRGRQVVILHCRWLPLADIP